MHPNPDKPLQMFQHRVQTAPLTPDILRILSLKHSNIFGNNEHTLHRITSKRPVNFIYYITK